MQLPAAFRSLSRLSSAPSARASALRPFLLNLLIFDLRFSGGLAIALAFLQFFDALLSARISPCVPQGVSIALVFRCLSTNPLQGFRSLRPLSDWCPHVASLFGFQGVIRGCTTSTLGRFSSHQELGTSSPSLIASEANSFIKKSRQPPALPCRLQHSTIGRKGLDRRVRDGYGYFPFTHRHRNCFIFTFLPPPTAGRTEMQSLLLP